MSFAVRGRLPALRVEGLYLQEEAMQATPAVHTHHGIFGVLLAVHRCHSALGVRSPPPRPGFAGTTYHPCRASGW